MSKRKVFISYSYKDKPSVDSLIKALDDQKVEYWTDHKIRAGQEWMKEIEKALYSASVYLFFISPDFLASDWAMFEIGLAFGRARESGALIIPVILRPTKLPDFIQQFHSIDANTINPSEFAHKIQKLVEANAT